MNTAALYVMVGIVSFLIMTYRESAYYKGIPLVHRSVGIFAILFLLLPALYVGVSYVFTFISTLPLITYPKALALASITYLAYYFVYKFWKNPPKV